MSNTLLMFLKMLIAALPFIALALLSRKVNLSRPERSKQYPMPAVTGVYVLVCMALMHRINDWLLELLDSIDGWFLALSKISWMPTALQGFWENLSYSIWSMLRGLELRFWIFFIANAVILLAYLIIKRIVIALLRKLVKPDRALFQRIAGTFYEQDAESGRWCLRESFVQVRGFLRVMYLVSIVISVLLMLASKFFYDQGWIRGIFYPVFGVLLISEMYFVLDGLTGKEMFGSIRGEDDASSRIANYTLIRKYLRALFGDKLSAENTGVNNGLSYTVTSSDLLNQLRESEDQRMSTMGLYYEKLTASGFEIDHNYLCSSIDLMNGKSVLFNNPFYQDLIPYIFYPMNRALLNHQKVLVVLGRHAVEDDVEQWLCDGIQAVTNIPFLWKITQLNEDRADTDIGILSRSQVLNGKVLEIHEDFLNEVGFMVILEPSRLISTAQIGLNLIVKKCQEHRPHSVVYCMCDKNCDGLVDAMSHVLLTNITEVSATEKHRGTVSYMCWDPDDEYLHHRMLPNIARYLGVGTELSFAALKNQVSQTTWYGGETFPVSDIRWIDKQYYYELMKYAQLPVSQDAMDRYFRTSPNFWRADRQKNQFLTVEDESFNMFEAVRAFSTRSTDQGFVNVISSQYLLRDYMADNAAIFETDSKAIPYISADYVRSPRNVVMRLILAMSTLPLPQSAIEKEFSLLGIRVFDLQSQLWYEIYRCFADLKSIGALAQDYREAVAECTSRALTENGETLADITIEILQKSERFNVATGRPETVWFIRNPSFVRSFVTNLRSASYVTEDEKGEKYYFGAELNGHIFQKYVPGQFFTFDGKYYEMMSVTADGHMLVRRAADHIEGRKFYRQLRTYRLDTVASDSRSAERSISGMRITRQYADITVQTHGYYEMSQYNDLRGAKKITFDPQTGMVPVRSYYNKRILRITLPDDDDLLTDSVCTTITVLMNEVFRTLFAENQPFIVAVTADRMQLQQEDRTPLTYTVEGDAVDPQEKSIYIIEDSQLDMGLLEAAERNLDRILDIITDYICWHRRQLKISLTPPKPVAPITFAQLRETLPEDEPEEGGKKKKKKLRERIKDFFRKIRDKFKKKKPEDELQPEEPEPERPEGDVPETPEDETPQPGFELDLDQVTDTDDETPVQPQYEEIPETPEDETPQPGFELDLDQVTDTDDETPVQPQYEEIPETTAGETPQPEIGFDLNPTADADEIRMFTEPQYEEVYKAPADETPRPDFGFGADWDWLKGTGADETSQSGDAPETPAAETTEPDADFGIDWDRLMGTTGTDVPETGENESDPDSAQMPSPNNVSKMSESDILSDWSKTGERRPYHERYYTLYGFSSEPRGIDLTATLEYLQQIRPGKNNPLRQARDSRKLSDYVASRMQKDTENIRYCDFCGAEIIGVEYDTLADGRDRCMNCGRTAIKTGEEFRKLYETVRSNMETFFGIRLREDVHVEMVNSWKLHKKLRQTFVPTKNPDPRVLGVAIKDKGGMSLLIENGSPRMSAMLTIAHELTHIWQYVNWNEKKIRRKYGKELNLQIYEGMAKWVEVQYAYLINEPIIAKRAEIETMRRADEYGFGFIRYRANYPIEKGVLLTGRTPFMNAEEPLDMSFCGSLDSMYIQPPDLPQPAADDADEDGDWMPSDPRDDDLFKTALGKTKERRPDSVRRYAYELLNDAEKVIYDKIYEAMASFAAEVPDLKPYAIDQARALLLVQYVTYDHPEIFWYAMSNVTFEQETGHALRLTLIYNMTEQKARGREQEIDAAVQTFLSCVSPEMSDFEIVLKVYENIIRLVDYDSVGLDHQTLRRQNNEEAAYEPDDLRSIYGVFVQKKAVCAGYARATQYLLNLLGIECAFYSNGEHAWNIVRLEGDYYHLDTTWGDSSNTKPEKNVSQEISYDCFCITSEEVAKLEMHQLNPDYPAPVCTAVRCNYFERFGLCFDRYDFTQIRDLVSSMIENGMYSISFKAASDTVYQQMSDALIGQHKMVDILQYVNLSTKSRVETTFSYTQNETRRVLKFFVKKK